MAPLSFFPWDSRNTYLTFPLLSSYTTTLPEAHAATAIDILEIVERSNDRRKRLERYQSISEETLRLEGFRVTGDAHILALEIGDEAKAINMARKLLQRNIFVLPARYPTVPLHRSILRIGVTALHEEKDIISFIDHVKEASEELE